MPRHKSIVIKQYPTRQNVKIISDQTLNIEDENLTISPKSKDNEQFLKPPEK